MAESRIRLRRKGWSGKNKMARKHINKKDELQVLIQSRRKCALCFGLDDDYRVKKGQIAHLDRNHENKNISNLVFLCLEHHDEYDSKTSQSKGWSLQEVLHYKKLLLKHINKSENESLTKNTNQTSDNAQRSFIPRNPYSYLYKWVQFLKDENYSFNEILSAFETNPTIKLDKKNKQEIELASVIIKHALGEIPDAAIAPYCYPTRVVDFTPIEEVVEGFLFKAITPKGENDFCFLIDRNASDNTSTIKEMELFLNKNKIDSCNKILTKVHSSYPWEISNSVEKIALAKLTWRDFRAF